MKKHNLTFAIALSFLSATQTFGSGMGESEILADVSRSYAGVNSYSAAYTVHNGNIDKIASIQTEAGLMTMLDVFLSPAGKPDYGILNVLRQAAKCKEALLAKATSIGISTDSVSRIQSSLTPKLTPAPDDEPSAAVAPTEGGSSGGSDMDVTTTSKHSEPLPEPVAESVDVVAALRAELERATARAEREKEIAMAKEQECLALRGEAGTLRLSYETTNAKWGSACDESEELRAQLARLRQELGDARGSSSSSSSSLSSLAAANAEKDAEIEMLKIAAEANQKATQASFDVLTSELSEKDKEIKTLSASMSSTAETFRLEDDSKRAQVQELEETLALEKRRYEALQSELDRVQSEKGAEISALVAKVSALDTTSAEQLKNITQSAERIEQLTSEAKALETAKAKLDAELSSLRAQFEAREATIAQVMTLLSSSASTLSGGSFGGPSLTSTKQ